MLRELVRRKLSEALGELYGLAGEIEVSVPERPEFGDLSSVVAFSLKEQLKRAPRQIAEELVAHLESSSSAPTPPGPSRSGIVGKLSSAMLSRDSSRTRGTM